MPALQVSVRELHARTGHYVRKAAGKQRVIVTDHGKPIAELAPLSVRESRPFFSQRKLRSDFQKLSAAGKLRPPAGARDITDLISDERE